MKKISCLIQARTNSQRFPGKIYHELCDGVSVLESAYRAALNVCGELKKLKTPEFSYTVAVIGPHEDKRLKEFCAQKKIEAIFPLADENDLATRYLKAAQGSDYIARWTSDCHAMPQTAFAMGMVALQNTSYDYGCNTAERTFPEGCDIQIASLDFWKWASKNVYANKEHPLVHVDLNQLVREEANRYGFKTALIIDPEHSYLRKYGSIDTEEDLKRVKEFYKNEADKNQKVS